MKAKILLILMGLILCVQGCATVPPPDITAVPSPDQKIAYDGTLYSRKKHSLSLTPFTDFDNAISEFNLAADNIKLMLTVKNGGKEPITIGCENLSASIADDENNGEPKQINVQSLDEVMEDFQKEYNNHEKQFFYSNFWNYSQLIRAEIAIEVITKEEWRDRMLDLWQAIRMMRMNEEGIREVLEKLLLTQQTIMPDSSYTGIVVCDTHDLNPETSGTFRMVVSVDGEDHQFNFNRNLSK